MQGETARGYASGGFFLHVLMSHASQIFCDYEKIVDIFYCWVYYKNKVMCYKKGDAVFADTAPLFYDFCSI